MVLVGITVFIVLGYLFKWDWTGFNSGTSQITITNTSKGNYTATIQQPGKTLWDWLQLFAVFAIPVVVGLGATWLSSRQNHDREIAKQRYEQDQTMALDKQREDIFQAYLHHMSELLLKEKLRSSEVDAEVRNVARVRTINVITQLDARRLSIVFAFLREAGLMLTTSNDNVVSLRDADLHSVNWEQANLSRVNLSGADLSQADLSQANLSGANLSQADLSHANLKSAFGVTVEELEKQTKSLKGATMPDGSIHP
jgi:hypothetical protein